MIPRATDGGRDVGPTAIMAADAGGPPLAPYPPATCSDQSWVPAVPGHASVNSCGGQLPLSSRLTTNGAAPPHFYRCGTLGPEIETDLRLSPDGARLATLTGAGTVRLFATDEWLEIAQLAPQAGRVDAFAFSRDGTRLATLSMERGELTVWNAADGTPQTTFTGKGTEGGIPLAQAALAFSRDGHRIASSLGTIVDLGDRSTVTLNLEQGSEAYVEQMAFTMCDAKLYVRSYSQTGDSFASTDAALYDTQTGVVQWVGGGPSFAGSALSQDGRLLAVASRGYNLSIYRGDTGELVDYQPNWQAGSVQAFTPDDTALVVLNGTELDQWRIADGTVSTITFFGTGYRLLGFPGPEAIMIGTSTDAEALSLSPSYHPSGSLNFGANVASWTADGTAGAAIAADGSLFHVWHEPDEVDICAPTAPGPTAAATSFGLSGDGQVLGVGKADGVIDLFDTATGLRRGAIETLQGPVATTALSWDGTTAAARTAAFDAPVQVWSANGGTLNSVVLSLAGSPSRWSRFALSPDAGTIAANDGLASTAFIDVTTGAVQPVQPFSFSPWLPGAPFSPDSAHMAGWIGALATWHVPDAVRDDVLLAPADLAPANPSTTPVSLGLASDWSVAAALSGTSLLVWDPRTGVELLNAGGVQAGAPAGILGVAGSTVAVNQYLTHTFWADYDVANLYDVPTGAELRTFGGYSENAGWSLLLGPDGSHAYTLEPPDVITWCR